MARRLRASVFCCRAGVRVLAVLVYLLVACPLSSTAVASPDEHRKSTENAVWGPVVESMSWNKLTSAVDFVSGLLFARDSSSTTTFSRSRPPSRQGLHVIGAGFARTGTKSTEAALQMLGHKVYDMRSLLQRAPITSQVDDDEQENMLRIDQWLLAAREYNATGSLLKIEALTAELEAEGYTATLDAPMCLFAPILAEIRPQAKVLLTVRDSDEKWVHSWFFVTLTLGRISFRPWSWLVGDLIQVGQISEALEGFEWEHVTYPTGLTRVFPWYERRRAESVAALKSEASQQRWIGWYRGFRTKLTKQVSKERLLEFNVKQGWEPLTKFLEIPSDEAAAIVAANPFPNVNDRKTLMYLSTLLDILAAGLPLWIFALSCGLAKIFLMLMRLFCARSSKDKSD